MNFVRNQAVATNLNAHVPGFGARIFVRATYQSNPKGNVDQNHPNIPATTFGPLNWAFELWVELLFFVGLCRTRKEQREQEAR